MVATAEQLDTAWWDAWRGVVFAQARILHAVERSLKKHSGLSLASIDALGRVYDSAEGRLRMQDIQERSLFTFSGMTRVIDRLESLGLVRREQVPGDRRGVFVVITPEGRETYSSAIEKHRADIEREFGARLTPEQHRAVAEALRQFWDT